MDDLWKANRQTAVDAIAPLASRIRPTTLDQIVGQTHLLAPDKLLRRMIDADALTSVILHGPPGTGKTTLAEVIAKATKRRFIRENAASVGVKRIREIIDDAYRVLGDSGKRTILFLDEIHRFSKSQQDVLLADVERGLITLIGATTENPLFAVNAALISRSTLFRLESLSEQETEELIERALSNSLAFPNLNITIDDDAKRVWAIKSEGDARRALTALEVAIGSSKEQSHGMGYLRRDSALDDRSDRGSHHVDVAVESSRRQTNQDEQTTKSQTDPTTKSSTKIEPKDLSKPSIHIDKKLAEDSIQQKVANYGDDGHYDTISAMIKSIRGSDPDAAVYWIAKMLDAGEDPRFICRRLAILASEDIGNADPRAIMIAQAAWNLVERIGMPEARITISQCATYLACCPKSNAAYVAIDTALDDVRKNRVLPVPIYLRDSNTSPQASDDGSGQRIRDIETEKYEYSHATENQLTGQDYLGVDKQYYEPKDVGSEKILKAYLEEARAKKDARRKS
ncbi:MAG: replication-associated recombination protein A [Phycisphaerales bacterium]|nr:replication-associated recombination protein A [Phycisphaerales bacterium]